MRFKVILLFLLVFSAGCKKHKDLFPGTVIGGHACAGLHISSSNYHDNSLEAYRYARSFDQIGMVEVDAQLSSEGTLWLYHDPELSTESSGTGYVSQRSDAYLSGLKYRSLEKEQLIRLEDLPADLKGIRLLIDLKESDGTGTSLVDSTMLIDALKAVKQYFYNGNLAIVTNSGRFMPTLKVLGFEVYYNVLDAAHFLNGEYSLVSDGAIFRNSAVSATDVSLVQELGKEVIIYDVRSPKGIRSAFEKSPDFLLTDDIKATLIEKYK